VAKELEKIDSVISEKRIKLHIFAPSQRKIWTIVGEKKEYWFDPEMNFCSCQSFYFNSIEGKRECYHLKSVSIAEKENKIELIKFSDDEFSNFILGLVTDL
jgi:predicted nucleic acid-binding Zn finger protein